MGSIRRTLLLRLLLLPSLLLTSCSDKQLVANSAAKYTFDEWQYEENCARPTTAKQFCGRCYDAIQEYKRVVQILNDTQKIGNLPPEAKKKLKEAADGLDRACR